MPEVVATKQLRAFGVIVGGGFALIGLWPALWRGTGMRLWAVGLATVLILSGLVWPQGLLHPYRLWMAIGHVLGSINTKIILGVIFYALFTPIAILRRIKGKDVMQLKIEPQLDTYRLRRQPRHPSHMKRQF